MWWQGKLQDFQSLCGPPLWTTFIIRAQSQSWHWRSFSRSHIIWKGMERELYNILFIFSIQPLWHDNGTKTAITQAVWGLLHTEESHWYWISTMAILSHLNRKKCIPVPLRLAWWPFTLHRQSYLVGLAPTRLTEMAHTTGPKAPSEAAVSCRSVSAANPHIHPLAS